MTDAVNISVRENHRSADEWSGRRADTVAREETGGEPRSGSHWVQTLRMTPVGGRPARIGPAD